MNKKVLTLFLLLVALSTISIVSAADTQKIGGVEFNVPEGYAFDADTSNAFLDSLEKGKVSDVGVFKNSDGDTVFIMVYDKTPETSDFPSDYKFENKTINNKNGTFMSADSRINIAFEYQDGDKFIVIQANDEDTLKEVIK